MTALERRQYYALAGTALRLMAFHDTQAVPTKDVLANLPDPVPVPEDQVKRLLEMEELLRVDGSHIRVKSPITVTL